MSSHFFKHNIVFGSLMLAVGVAVAGYFVSQTLYKFKIALNTAEVKGLAERRVEADTCYWSIKYTVTGKDMTEMVNLYEASQADQTKIIALLKDNDFLEDEIKPGVIEHIHKEFRDGNNNLVEERYLLVGEIEVQTNKIHQVAKVRAQLNKLTAQGLDITNNPPAYHFTKLNDIKPEMLKEATKNARIAADEFAVNAGVKVGRIQSARQGGFTICDIGEEYGDTKKIEKDVRVVTNIVFFLTD